MVGTQTVKSPPAMLETWVRSLDWEDHLEKGTATRLQYSCLENTHGQRSLVGQKESDTTEQLKVRENTHTLTKIGTKRSFGYIHIFLVLYFVQLQ